MIMELCEELERWMGERVSKRWWEKEGIDLAGFQAEADKMEEYKEGMEMLETENMMRRLRYLNRSNLVSRSQ